MKSSCAIFVAFIVSLLLGYAHEIVPIVSNWTTADVHLMGSLAQYEAPCTPLHSGGTGICRTMFLIPTPKHDTSTTVLTGFIVRAVGARCSGEKSYIRVFDSLDSPGSDRGESNKLKLITLNTSKCDELILESWTQPDEFRFGWQGGGLLIGEMSSLQRIAKFVEFFSNDLRIVWAVFLVFLGMLLRITSRFGPHDLPKNSFENASIAYTLVGLLNSGLLAKAVPWFDDPNLLSSLSIALSTWGTVLVLFSNEVRILSYRNSSAAIAVALIVLTVALPSQASHLVGPLNLAIAGVFFVFELSRKRRLSLLAFSFLTAMASLKLCNYWWAPQPHVHMLFYGGVLFWSFTRKIITYLQISTTLLTKTSVGRSSTPGESSLSRFQRSLSATLEGCRVSVFNIAHGKHCEATIVLSGRVLGEFTLETLPPVVAHAVATNSDFLHADSNSISFQNIRRSREQNGTTYKHNLVSVLNIHRDGVLVGTVAITDYPGRYSNEPLDSDFFFINSKLSVKVFAELLGKSNAASVEATHRRVLEVTSSIHGALSRSAGSAFSEHMLTVLCREFECRGFYAELSPEDSSLHLQCNTGYDDVTIALLAGTRFYIFQENQHGPVALAASRLEPVIIEDISWLDGVIKERTRNFFQSSKAKSAIAIPVLSVDKKACTGVYWLDSKDYAVFRSFCRDSFVQLMLSLSSATAENDHKNRSSLYKKALTAFVPSDEVERVTTGNTHVVNRSTGYLLMVDLIGSTNLASTIGGPAFGQKISELGRMLEESVKPLGWCLREIQWDAFIFTLESPVRLKDEQIDLVALIDTVDGAINTDGLSSRKCLVYGDISMGIMRGPNKAWGFVGTARADVAKLEERVKNLGPGFFVQDTALSNLPLGAITDTGKKLHDSRILRVAYLSATRRAA